MKTIKLFMKLIRLVKPMLGIMTIAILMGTLGFLCAIFIPFLLVWEFYRF